MVNSRPSPAQVAARKLEIALRYKRQAAKARNQNRSRGMAAIRLAELTRWLDDQFGQGTELEPGSQGETIARVFAHHLAALPDAGRRISSWLSTYAPWISLRSQERLISEATHCPLKWSADKLAWKLRLDDTTRTRLNIRTIGAIDCNRDQRKARDKARRAERERHRRAAKRATRVPCI